MSAIAPITRTAARQHIAPGVARAARQDTAVAPGEEVIADSTSADDVPWVTIVWNDPVNLMSYVTYVFQTMLGHPRPKAEKLMLDVHHKGRATVSHGTRDAMEMVVTKLHGAGLWATMARDR